MEKPKAPKRERPAKHEKKLTVKGGFANLVSTAMNQKKPDGKKG